MGVLTGIIRVIRTGIFSDLNNLKVYSILEKKYSDFFGFTERIFSFSGDGAFSPCV